MKIGLVSPYDWSYPGGVKSHIERLAQEMRARGHTVRILTALSGPANHEVEFGIYKFGWVAPLHINGSVARVSVSPDLRGALRRILLQERFDVVHVHEPFASTLSFAAVRIVNEYKTASVATFHASTTQKASGARMAYAMASPFLQKTFHKIDSLIAVSEAAREHIAAYFDGDFHIIPNGLSLRWYEENARPLEKYRGDAPVILFLARLEPRKGLRYLLQAIPLIIQSARIHNRPIPRIVIVGDGSQLQQYQRYVEKKGWDNVEFTGYIEEQLKPAYYASAAIYCAPNTGNESQGYTLLEAMASGAAVVASDIPGYHSVITGEKYGLLTPPKDHERLAWAINDLLDHPEKRAQIIANGKERVKAFDWSIIADTIENVYHESVEHKKERIYLRKLLIEQKKEENKIEPKFLISPAIIPLTQTTGWDISAFDENVVE